MPARSIAWFSDLTLADLDQVGGKNASLGEMVRNLTSAGVRVPDGFATTAAAYRRFITDSGLAEMLNTELNALDTENIDQLAAVGRRIREAMIRQPRPANLEADIRAAYARLAGQSGKRRQRCGVLRSAV
jgi:pyruvate,water dikinase